jgi:hypothetical protein
MQHRREKKRNEVRLKGNMTFSGTISGGDNIGQRRLRDEMRESCVPGDKRI